jgi:hypothetical protein
VPKSTSSLPTYVVELQVSGVAVVTVEAETAETAGELAEKRVTPADVTELDVTEVSRIASLAPARPRPAAGAEARVPERPPNAVAADGQA